MDAATLPAPESLRTDGVPEGCLTPRLAAGVRSPDDDSSGSSDNECLVELRERLLFTSRENSFDNLDEAPPQLVRNNTREHIIRKRMSVFQQRARTARDVQRQSQVLGKWQASSRALRKRKSLFLKLLMVMGIRGDSDRLMSVDSGWWTVLRSFLNRAHWRTWVVFGTLCV
ncbi:MAG: hypothetical protein ACO32I_08920, partial [Candidatus Limnocylindrus sp.]